MAHSTWIPTVVMSTGVKVASCNLLDFYSYKNSNKINTKLVRQVMTSSILLFRHEWSQKTRLVSRTEQLKREQKCLKVIGFGRLFGWNQRITNTALGRDLEKSTLSKFEATMISPVTRMQRLTVVKGRARLFIGGQVQPRIVIGWRNGPSKNNEINYKTNWW